jgi:hypothetical protein
MTDERPPEAAARRTTRTASILKGADIVARLIWIDEALGAGDVRTAHAVLLDLIADLRPKDVRAACPECGLRAWPGQLAAHRSNVHHVDPWAEAA